MKKQSRSITLKADTSRPTKPSAPAVGTRLRASTSQSDAPAYDGPTKTSRRPSRTGKTTAPTKPTARPQDARSARAATDVERGDQKARASRGKAASGQEQYVRLSIRVRNDRLMVLDSHLVDGPLAQTQGFAGANAYEVTLGDRLLHAGVLPDIGIQRSFVNPSGPLEQRAHHITERPIYEFTARVPASEISRDTIGKMAVRLYRLKDEARTDRLGSQPLAQQFARQVRQVAELVGLPTSVLPAHIEERGARTPTI